MSEVTFEYILPKGTFKVFNQKPIFDFLKAKQIHSNIVLNEKEITATSEADGIWGNSKVAQCILTADCLPIVIEGKLGHASLHAGWMGVRDLIAISENVKKIEPTLAFIGPHICVNCYEVQADFRNHFPHSTSFKQIGNKQYFDLQNEVCEQLTKTFPNIKIIKSNQCTFENTQFHSFRRNKTSLRNFNIYFPQGDLS